MSDRSTARRRDVREIQAERERWLRFERRDGWYSGFLVGLAAGALIAVLTIFVGTLIYG